MTQLSYASPNPIDTEHVRILAICYYVLSGILALFACCPSVYLIMGAMMITGSFPSPPAGSGSGPPPPPAVGWIIIAFASVFILLGWAVAILTFVAARALKAHRSHTFCIVMAAIICLWVPIGTVLGIFTFIVLMRPGVKAMFAPAGFPVTGGTS